MRIGPIEITWKPRVVWLPLIGSKDQPQIDRTGVFAVPNDEPWWLAVHETINEAEAETTVTARRSTLHPYGAIAAVSAGEGCDLVRQKLINKRKIALKEVRGNAIQTGNP